MNSTAIQSPAAAPLASDQPDYIIILRVIYPALPECVSNCVTGWPLQNHIGAILLWNLVETALLAKGITPIDEVGSTGTLNRVVISFQVKERNAALAALKQVLLRASMLDVCSIHWFCPFEHMMRPYHVCEGDPYARTFDREIFSKLSAEGREENESLRKTMLFLDEARKALQPQTPPPGPENPS